MNCCAAYRLAVIIIGILLKLLPQTCTATAAIETCATLFVHCAVSVSLPFWRQHYVFAQAPRSSKCNSVLAIMVNKRTRREALSTYSDAYIFRPNSCNVHIDIAVTQSRSHIALSLPPLFRFLCLTLTQNK